MAVDSLKRSALHFAVTSNNAELVNFLLYYNKQRGQDNESQKKVNKDLLFSRDINQLTALHYAVLNEQAAQVEIMNILIQNQLEVDAVDEEGKTPLHHACIYGMPRAIPILIKNGANITRRDLVQKKTPVELAKSEKIRKLVTEYTAMKVKETNEKDFVSISKGILNQESSIHEPEKQILQITEPPKINPYEEDYSPVTKFFRCKFFSLMKTLQHSGVKAMHHLRKPYIYTGSWMENLQTLEQLYEEVKGIPPAEVMIRTFNVMCPYDKPLPLNTSKQQEDVQKFFGQEWYDGNTYNQSQNLLSKDLQNKLNEYQCKIDALAQALEMRDGEKELANIEVQSLKSENAQLQYDLKMQNIQMQMKIDNQSKLLQSREEQLKQTTQKMAQQDLSMEKLKAELNQYKQTLTSENEQKLQQLKNQLTDKENAIKNLNKQLQEAQSATQQRTLKTQQNAAKMFQDVLEEKKRKMNAKTEEVFENNEAILTLFKNLERYPPHSMIQRLANVSQDKSDKISKLEFRLFLEQLKVTDQKDVDALNRIVGFTNNNNAQQIEIEKIKDIIEDCPVIADIFLSRFYEHISKEMKTRNLTAEYFFTQMDIDSDSQITPEELWYGVETLKIFLNVKDKNRIWKSIDIDGNGSISCQEIGNILDKWQQTPPQYPEITFAERLGKNQDPYEQNLTPIVCSGDQEANIFDATNIKILESPIAASNLLLPLVGNLKIQLKYGKGLLNQSKLKMICTRFLLKGSENPQTVKSILRLDDSSWNIAIQIQLRSQLIENVSDFLRVQLFCEDVQRILAPDQKEATQNIADSSKIQFHNRFNEESFLGEARLFWKKTLEKPNEWLVSHEFQLGNITYLKQNMKQVSGQVAIQLKWIPGEHSEEKDELESQMAQFSEQTSEKQFMGSIIEVGIIETTIIQAFLSEQHTKVSCKTILPLGTHESYDAQYDINKNPYWGQTVYENLKLVSNNKIDCVHIQLQHSTGIFSNESLGDFYVNWKECLEWPGEYLTKKAYLFKQHPQQKTPHKIYVKIRWIPQSIFQQLTGYQMGSFKEKMKEIQKSKASLQEGILKVFLVRAKNLRAADSNSSDPFVQVEFRGHNQVLQQKSKYKKATLNPQWYEQLTFTNIQFFKEGPVPVLNLQIIDFDLVKNDSIGKLDLDITACIKNPCTWAINDYFDIVDECHKGEENKPQIYLQVYFVPKGEKDPNIKPKDKENIRKEWEENTCEGTLKVKIVHARGLKIADSRSSDPYTTVVIPNYPNQIEKNTSTIASTINPIWNETFTEKFLVPLDKLQPLKIIVKDSDFLAKDDILGYCEIPIKECIDQPGEWKVNQIFELQGTPEMKQQSKKKLLSLGYIYIQVKFLEQGMIDDGVEATQVENLAEMISKNQGMYNGVLKVFLVHCENLVQDGSDIPDPVVVFKVPGGKKVESKQFDNVRNPVWKTIYSIPIQMALSQIQPMRVEIYDHNLISDVLLGYLNIQLNEVFQNPQVWQVNQIFKIDGDTKMRQHFKTDNFGEIYMQMMYVPQGIKDSTPSLPLTKDIDEQIRKQKEEDVKPIKGILQMNFVMARGLRIADALSKSSDPYVEVHFPKDKKINGPVIEKTLNPVWNFQYKHMIDFIQKEYQDITVIVKDSDNMAVDDILGQIKIDWKKLIEENNIGQWLINDLFKLSGDTQFGKDLGEIYIQCRFLKESDQINSIGQQFPKTIPNLFDDYGRVIGNLKFKIMSAVNIINVDYLSKTDPFALAYLSINKDEKIKTSTQNNNLNPIWNQEGVFSLNALRSQLKVANIVVQLFDDENLSSDLIGQTEIPLLDALERPEEPIEMEYQIQNAKKKDSKTKYGNFRLWYKWEESKESEGVKGLREPEKSYNGDLLVKIWNCKNLNNKGVLSNNASPYIAYNLTNNIKKFYETKVIKNNLNPKFDDEFKIPITITATNSQSLRLQLQVKNSVILADPVLCGCTINLAQLFEKPCQVDNQYRELRDSDGKAGKGFANVALAFIPEGKSLDETEVQKSLELDFEQFQKSSQPPTIKSIVKVNIIGARKLKSDLLDKIDPFIEVKCSMGTKKIIKTQVKDNTEQPIWNCFDEFELDIQDSDYKNLKLYFVLFDQNYTLNSVKGKYEMGMSELYSQNPQGQWFNKIVPLLNENNCPGAGELYIQIQMQIVGQEFQKDLPENLFELEIQQHDKEVQEQQKKKEEEDQIPLIKGDLLIKIVQASNLLKLDPFNGLSDPFAVVKINKGCLQQLTTQTKNDNCDPEWNYQGKLHIELKKNNITDVYIQITIYDYDVISNNYLGYVENQIDDLLSQNNQKWVNEIFQLKDSKGVIGKNGIIYLQYVWLLDGVDETQIQFPPQLDIQQYYKGSLPQGTIVIKAVEAQDILGVEKKGQSSDAQLVITFGKKSMTTKYKSSLNPQWNEIFYFDINYKDRSNFPFLHCQLEDWNQFLPSTYLGDFETNINEILDDPMKWKIKKVFKLNNLKKQKIKNNEDIKGAVTLWIGFAPKGQDSKQFVNFQ